MKSFSIIIPTLNEQNFIGELINDILNQNLRPEEIIVVDGFSTDKTREIAQKYKAVKLLKCPPHVASQRNYGARFTTGELLYFLDADTRLTKDFFSNSQKKLGKAGIACPYYLPYNSNFFIFIIYLFFNAMFFLFQKISASGAGSAIIVKKSVFLKLNGFDINVRFEDIEFIRRAAGKYNFRIISVVIWVSDRRFKRYGILKTFLQYLILSTFFLFNQFNYSGLFSYEFGKYKSNRSV